VIESLYQLASVEQTFSNRAGAQRDTQAQAGRFEHVRGVGELHASDGPLNWAWRLWQG